MAESKRKKSKSKPRPNTNKIEKKELSKAEATVEHRSFRLSQAIVLDTTGLPTSFNLLWETIKDTYKYRWRTLFFILSYGLIWYGMTYSDVSSTISALYGSIFGIVAFLASVWMVRHRDAGDKVTIRFAYYRGMVQLIPFVLVLAVLTVQLAPTYLGFAIFEIATSSGAVVTALEQTVPLVIWVFGGMLSFYWITPTIIAMYVVTIPGTLPMEALYNGKKLVDGRRWFIQRRMLIGISALVGMYALIAYLFASLEWSEGLRQLSIIFPIAIIPLVNTYFYKLYKSLLK